MSDELAPSHGQFLVYEAEDGKIKIDVRFEDDTVWLTQGMMAELFQTSQQNISQHVLNIYEEEELPPESTHKKFLLVRQEGARSVKRLTDFHNLDMIISVGYRVKNYLSEPELAALNNLVEQYLVFAEGQAMRRVPMHMRDWLAKLDGFLTINDREILNHAGRISHELAMQIAEEQYEKFHAARTHEDPGALPHLEEAVKQIPKRGKSKTTLPKDPH